MSVLCRSHNLLRRRPLTFVASCLIGFLVVFGNFPHGSPSLFAAAVVDDAQPPSPPPRSPISDDPLRQPTNHNSSSLPVSTATTPLASPPPKVKGTFRQKPEDMSYGCKELRSKRYISDGFCTATKPITEVVCTGSCLPASLLPWYAEYVKLWARTKVLEWRCVDDVKRRQKVRLQCENGDTRTYEVKVVRSCKCKRQTSRHASATSPSTRGKGKDKAATRKRRRRHRPRGDRVRERSEDL